MILQKCYNNSPFFIDRLCLRFHNTLSKKLKRRLSNSTIYRQGQQPFYNDNLPSGFDYNVNVDISSNGSSSHNDKENHINDKDTVNNFRPTYNSNKSLIHLHPFESVPIKAINNNQSPIPSLTGSLSRVLFQPYNPLWLRCPRTGVYNFPSHLEDIHPPEEFAFDRLPPYLTSSKDEELIKFTKINSCRYLGSTSTMTGVLAHLHFMLTNWKNVNFETLSEELINMPAGFSSATKLPSAIILKKVSSDDGNIYAIDKDKTYDVDEDNVLLWVGTQLEKQLTMHPDEFSGLLRKNPITQTVLNRREEREAYHYSKANKILMRSQLDCYDERLPRKTFDIKTRACVAVRHDILNYKAGGGYLIKKSKGLLESFEREYFDMVRGAFLKYSLQARIGAMDGIFVAYHNTQRLFGFQYVPLEEMDERIYGSSAFAEQCFRHSIGILENVLDQATKLIPNQSLSLTFDTRENENYMSVYVESLEENQVYLIDVNVKSIMDGKGISPELIDFNKLPNSEKGIWETDVITHISSNEDRELVKMKLENTRKRLRDFSRPVVLPPGQTAQDIYKAREERRGWRVPKSEDESLQIKKSQLESQLNEIIKQKDIYKEEIFNQYIDKYVNNNNKTDELIRKLKTKAKNKSKSKFNELKKGIIKDLNQLYDDRPNAEQEIEKVLKPIKVTRFVNTLREISKRGWEERKQLELKFSETDVKNRENNSERMFANIEDSKEHRDRLKIN